MRGLQLIEVCASNPACDSSLFALEQEFPEVTVLETDCLSHCELCARETYVLFDGSILTSTDVPSLISLLRDRLGHADESPL